MAKYRKQDFVVAELNADWDTYAQNRKIKYRYGSEAIAQTVETRLQTIQGEWHLDLGLGVPYKTEILIKGSTLASIEALVAKTVLDTRGVAELLEIKASDAGNRRVRVDFKFRDVFGQINQTEVEQ